MDQSWQINRSVRLPTEIRKILICGLGSIGRRHLRILRQYWKSVDVGILRSGYGPYAQEVKLASQVFTILDDAVLWKPDAAIICTPASEHLRVALPLARNRVPLLIEKPVGDGRESRDDWQELIQLSSNVPIEVGYVFRHDPCAANLLRCIKERLVGRLVEADFYCGSWLPDWRPSHDYRDCVSAKRAQGGGALLELSHELDLAQYLLGNLDLRSALLHRSGLLEIDAEDQAHLFAYSEDQCVVSIRVNFCTRPSSRHIHIRGRDGEIYWDLLTGRVEVMQACTSQRLSFQSPISSDERYRVQMEHFLSCAVGKAKPACSISDGLKILDIAAKAHEFNSGCRF